MKRTVVVCVLALITGCGKKKDEPKPTTGSGSAQTGSGSAEPVKVGSGSGSATGSGSGSAGTAAASGCTPPETIDGAYTVTKKCDVKLAGSLDITDTGTLTIEEGAKLAFPKDAHLDVVGKLVAKGTKDAPVVFTSADATPNPGDWEGILFQTDTKTGSVLDHVKVELAGKGLGHGPAAIRLVGEVPPDRVTITNSEIVKSTGAGIVVEGSKTKAKIEGNTFANDDKTSIAAPADVWSSIGVNACGDQLAHVTGGEFTKTGSWPKLDAAYVIDVNFGISGPDAPVLTLPEGATVKFARGTQLVIGADPGGGLVAKKVTFTSASPTQDAGDWGGIVIQDKATGTTIDECTIEFAGASNGFGEGAVIFPTDPEKVSKRVTITKTTIQKSTKNSIQAPDSKCGPYAEAAAGNKAEGSGASLCLK